MKRIFIFSPPRHRGDLLVRVLDASPGIRCAGESHDFLQRLRRLHSYRGALLRDHPDDFPAEGGEAGLRRFLNHSTDAGWDAAVRGMMDAVCEPAGEAVVGMRDIFTLRGEWEGDADFLSWIQFLDPEALLVFLKRKQEEVEISAEVTFPLWVPAYGRCAGSVLRRIRAVWDVMDRYHALNPESTVVLDSAGLLDFGFLSGLLSAHGIPVGEDAWKAETARVLGRMGDEDFLREKRQAKGERHGGFDRLPLEEDPAGPGKVEVHTLRFGGADWLQPCARSLEAWCDRTGADLKITDQWDPAYPSPKFAEIDMLREFLEGDAELLVYVDGDVMVHPSAPAMDPGWKGFRIMPDQYGGWVKGWRGWCRENFGDDPLRWTYRNAGVWVCDRESAARVLAETEGRLVAGMMEQHQFNLWLYRAAVKGLVVRDLEGKWNRFRVDERPAWFYHMAGKDKAGQLRVLRDRGVLPAVPEAFELLPDPELPRAIVYPWLSSAAAWQELKFSLRSVEKHFTDTQCPVFILGDKRPEWLLEGGRVVFLEAAGYARALQAGVQLAREVLWMNDDIYLRRPCGWEDFRVGLEMEDDLFRRVQGLRKCTNAWKRGLGRVALTARHLGAEAVGNFSTHTPYLFERGRAVEVLRRFGSWHKMPFETAYWNLHRDLPRKRLEDERDTLVLNHSDRTLPQVRGEIEAAFPHPAAWEF